MNPVLRVVTYLVLVAGACLFGHRAYTAYASKAAQAARRFDIADSTNAPPPAAGLTAASQRPTSTHLGFYGAAAFAMLVGIGLLAARDVSELVGQRAAKEMLEGEGEIESNPEYDQAEQTWANGDYLEAIRLLREYLQRHPRELHAAIRIAEIYEKDLNNPLAAALEYEEILKAKLPAERWGWAAIHLCNLYLRLNQTPKATALLLRIDTEYPETAAADKARKRLALMSGEATAATEGEQPEPPA